jgi:putative ABC transport system permease protein
MDLATGSFAKNTRMLKNFLKVAWRSLRRGKGFSVINISGLAVGMATALLILLWVQNEFSYDSFYTHSDRLYQLWRNGKDNTGITSFNITPQILGPTLKQDYPEVERATRVFWDETLLLSRGEKKINIKGTMADPDFLEMFDFPLVAGDRATALSSPTQMVITERMAKVFFGNEDPVGKTLRIDNKYDYAVSAVLKDLPNNTQFDFEYVLPWDFVRMQGGTDSLWDKHSVHNFVQLKPHVDLAAFNAKTKNIYTEHGNRYGTTSFLYPVSWLRLYSDFEDGKPAGGRIERVRIFTVIAVFILLIACINFMNMSTARSEKRAKEVGIRKVSGALRGSLIGQFLGESVLLAALAGVFALGLVEVLLPFFNSLTGKTLVIGFEDWRFWVAFIGFVVFTGVLAGSYPAVFLSSFRPVAVLKGSFKKGGALITPRKVLVVLQFTFAIVLIICTIIIEKQVEYARDRETGYNKRNMIYSFLSGDIGKNYDAIKNELLSQGIATAVTRTSAPLTESWSAGGEEWPGKDPDDRTTFNEFYCDGGIVRTAGLQLVAGRDIDPQQYPTDSTAVLLNETAVKVMGFKNPLGMEINPGHWGAKSWRVVGVVKDFIMESPFEKIKPMVINGPKASWFNLFHIKLNEAHSTAQSLAAVERVLKQYNPLYPFEYHFIDQQYAKKFDDEKASATLTAVFAGLTIFISCLGLFGLAAYMAENRTKEIGVRKVLGASIGSILTLLSKDFVKLVLIALVVASPVAWLVMSRWLAKYAYHIGIPVWVFVMAGVGAVVIAVATVSFQAIRAALANPVKALRSE